MDISILRKKPEDRVRTIYPFGGKDESVEVLFLGLDDLKKVGELAKELTDSGTSRDDSFNLAYGRVAVRGWSGLDDGDNPLALTPENIDMMMLGSSEFRSAVLSACSSLRGGVEKN
jgi:hypothetical protein